MSRESELLTLDSVDSRLASVSRNLALIAAAFIYASLVTTHPLG